MEKALLKFFLFSILMMIFVSGAFAATIHLRNDNIIDFNIGGKS